jgi:4-hydroxy-3-polyprenylbenzoate decarboxylase
MRVLGPARPSRIIVGMSGATGATYGIRLLQVLQGRPDLETHVILSPAARQTIALETDWNPRDVEALATIAYRHGDIAAAPSSGSYPFEAMVVVPCSMTTLSGIARTAGENLITRAADVCLKERRRLVLVSRETPLHLGHLRLMAAAAELGDMFMPPLPAFYHRPTSIEEIVDQTVGRILDQLDIDLEDDLFPRWSGPTRAAVKSLEPLGPAASSARKTP